MAAWCSLTAVVEAVPSRVHRAPQLRVPVRVERLCKWPHRNQQNFEFTFTPNSFRIPVKIPGSGAFQIMSHLGDARRQAPARSVKLTALRQRPAIRHDGLGLR